MQYYCEKLNLSDLQRKHQKNHQKPNVKCKFVLYLFGSSTLMHIARYDTLLIQYKSRSILRRFSGLVECSSIRVCSLTVKKDITNAGYLLFLQLHHETIKKAFNCLKKKFVKYVMLYVLFVQFLQIENAVTVFLSVFQFL